MQHDCTIQFTRVGLLAPEPIRRTGFVSVFEHHPYIKIVRGDLAALLADPTLTYIILDLSSHAAWIKVLFTVRRNRRDMRQIIVGPSASDELILQSISEGARAYLDPTCGPLALRQAVECVIEGTIWAPRRLLSQLVDRLQSHSTSPTAIVRPPVPTPYDLSPRESQVLDLILTARSNREIANSLGIEERTVKAHISSLFRKTGMENRVSLMILASQKGFARMQQPSLTTETPG